MHRCNDLWCEPCSRALVDVSIPFLRCPYYQVELTKLFKKGRTDNEIGKVLKLTPSQVRGVRRKLKLVRSSSTHNRWNNHTSFRAFLNGCRNLLVKKDETFILAKNTQRDSQRILSYTYYSDLWSAADGTSVKAFPGTQLWFS